MSFILKVLPCTHFLHICHPFLSKCLLWIRKCRKSNLVQFFYARWMFRRQCVNMIDTTWGRIYFLTWKFRTGILDTVCKDLYYEFSASLLFSVTWSFRKFFFWFAETFLIIINVKNQLWCLIFLWNPRHIIFRTLWWLESSTKEHLLETEIYIF